MKLIKYIFPVFLCLAISAELFADGRSVVFFFESLEGISPKVLQKIQASDNFCFSVPAGKFGNVSQDVLNLVHFNKIEPALTLMPEPYFPLVSGEIAVSDSLSFDRRSHLKQLVQEAKQTNKDLFDKTKSGLFLKGGILNEDAFDIFYKSNILWVTAQLENDLQKGVFIQNKTAVFVLHNDFPQNQNQIMNWLSEKQDKVIPIFLTKTHIKNEKFMFYLVDLFNKSKYTDVKLPLNAAYTAVRDYRENNIEEKLKFKTLSPVSQEVLLKIAKASQEVDSMGKDEQLYGAVLYELTNMYSYDIINGISNADEKALMLFNISYANIFKLSLKEVPAVEDLVRQASADNVTQSSTQTATLCDFIKTDDKMTINNEGLIKSFTVEKNEHSINFEVDLDTNLEKPDYIDIYIDMNGIAYTGSQNMLKNINGFFVPDNGWEYAIRMTDSEISIYRFSVDGQTLIKTTYYNGVTVSISSDILRGNPFNWSYQVIAVKNGMPLDFLEESSNKTKLFKISPLQLKMFKHMQ